MHQWRSGKEHTKLQAIPTTSQMKKTSKRPATGINNQHVNYAVDVMNDSTSLITKVLQCIETRNWTPADYNKHTMYTVSLAGTSQEYLKINELFKSTNKKQFNVTSIERIQNPFLMCAFLLKKEELRQRLGYEPEVRELFHGTMRAAVPTICKENFDWRRHGENRGFKFGKGVSFTPISNYATHYADKEQDGKVMFLAKVLVGEICKGYEGMLLPYVNCDTSEKENGDVIVKYEDNEFYPAYKITYRCTYNPKASSRRRHRRNKNAGTTSNSLTVVYESSSFDDDSDSYNYDYYYD